MTLIRRLLLALGLASLAIALALIAGAQLPDRALPVVIGVLAGVAASLPTSLLIVWRLTKAQPRPLAGPLPVSEERPPTVIVVPPAPAAPPMPAQPTPSPVAAPAPQLPGLVHTTRPAAIIGGSDDGGA